MYQIKTFEDVTIASCDSIDHAAMTAIGIANILGDDVWVWSPSDDVGGRKITLVMPASDSGSSDRTAIDCLRRELRALTGD